MKKSDNIEDDKLLREFFALREQRSGGDVPLPQCVPPDIMAAVRLADTKDRDRDFIRVTIWAFVGLVVVSVVAVVGLLRYYGVDLTPSDIAPTGVTPIGVDVKSVEFSLPTIGFSFTDPVVLMWVVILTIITGLCICSDYLSRLCIKKQTPIR